MAKVRIVQILEGDSLESLHPVAAVADPRLVAAAVDAIYERLAEPDAATLTPTEVRCSPRAAAALRAKTSLAGGLN